MLHRDDTSRYGTISRCFHWGMALVVLWQFLTVGARSLLEDSALDEFMWSTHKTTGLLIFALILARVGWALAHVRVRPPSVSLAAKLGHIALYGFLFVVPLLALLRQYGSGRTFEPLGLPLFPGFEGDKIEWLMAPANWLHGSLGWTLLALVVGHVFMAYWHRTHAGRTNVLPRMWR